MEVLDESVDIQFDQVYTQESEIDSFPATVNVFSNDSNVKGNIPK